MFFVWGGILSSCLSMLSERGCIVLNIFTNLEKLMVTVDDVPENVFHLPIAIPSTFNC